MSGQEIKRRLQLSPDNPWPGLESFDEASESFFFLFSPYQMIFFDLYILYL